MLLIEQLSTLIFIYIYMMLSKIIKTYLQEILRHCHFLLTPNPQYNLILFTESGGQHPNYRTEEESIYIYIRPTAIGHVLICVRL